jgi:hypothetical protein
MKKLTVVFAVLVSGFLNGQTTEEIEQYDTSKYEIIYTKLIQLSIVVLNQFISYEFNTYKFIRSIVIPYTVNNFRMIADSNVTKFK